MADENARLSLKVSTDRMALNRRVLDSLHSRLRLARPPRVIECCDISTTFGDAAVGSIVRFENGEPEKNGYRRYKIKSVVGSDDYAMMREVLERRFKRGPDGQDLPDLLVLDGGRGQLNVGIEVLNDKELAEKVDVVGMAKAPRRGGAVSLQEGEEERAFLVDAKDPVVLDPDSEECYFLQRIRDEAHRFAIAYHRKTRQRKSLGSILNDVPGLGESRRTKLLGHFGGLKGLRSASREEIASVPGIGPKLATAVYDRVHGGASYPRG